VHLCLRILLGRVAVALVHGRELDISPSLRHRRTRTCKFVVDFREKKVDCVSKKCLGISRRGVLLLVERWIPQQFIFFCKLVFTNSSASQASSTETQGPLYNAYPCVQRKRGPCIERWLATAASSQPSRLELVDWMLTANAEMLSRAR
jgi:hypothetical protein